MECYICYVFFYYRFYLMEEDALGLLPIRVSVHSRLYKFGCVSFDIVSVCLFVRLASWFRLTVPRQKCIRNPFRTNVVLLKVVFYPRPSSTGVSEGADRKPKI